MLDPAPSAVTKCLQVAGSKDYVFITCSGHGEHHVGNGLDDTMFYLNEKDSISISSVNPRNARHLVVVDVCRSLVRIQERVEKALKASLESYVSRSDVDYRKIFDDAVMKNSEGRIVAYSCDINQSAGDDGTGGIFTQQLLKAPERFKPADGGQYGIVNINQAFDVAKRATYEANAPQSAVFNGGRRQDFFPFAIVQ